VLQELPVEQAESLAAFRRYIAKSGKDRLDNLVHEYCGDRSDVSTRMADGKPYIEILRIADEMHANLIVMGVHGRNAIDLTLFGSTTNQIVRRAACPVLTWKQ
jgi:nucleotide-binding universal stress UspA family protein